MVQNFDDSDYECIKMLREIQILKSLKKYEIGPALIDVKI